MSARQTKTSTAFSAALSLEHIIRAVILIGRKQTFLTGLLAKIEITS